MVINELDNLLEIQSQVKKCEDFFEVVAHFRADGCANDRAFDLACQLLEIEKSNGSFMTGTIRIKYKNSDEQCFNVVMPSPSIKSDDQLNQLVYEHLISEINASRLLNRHTSVNDLETLLSYLSFISFKYHDIDERKNRNIEIYKN